MRRLALLLGLLLLGCPTADDDDSSPPDDDDSGAGDDDSGDDDTSADDDDTADDDDATPFDCATVPANPVSEATIGWARGHHGLTFSEEWLVGSDTEALIRSTRDGTMEVFLPGEGDVEGLVTLPDGDIVAASPHEEALLRITPEGGVSVLLSGVHPYSVLMGPDGKLWFAGALGADSWDIQRVDLQGGAPEIVATLPIVPGEPGGFPRGLDFNRAMDRLYVGTQAGYDTGRIYVVDLNANADALGAPWVFAEVGDGWVDAIAVDACDTLYVLESWTFSLYRVSPQGAVERWIDWSDDDGWYGHAAVWGTGHDGWRGDALYMPLPYGGNRVKELVLGVPPRTFAGEVLNGR